MVARVEIEFGEEVCTVEFVEELVDLRNQVLVLHRALVQSSKSTQNRHELSCFLTRNTGAENTELDGGMMSWPNMAAYCFPSSSFWSWGYRYSHMDIDVVPGTKLMRWPRERDGARPEGCTKRLSKWASSCPSRSAARVECTATIERCCHSGSQAHATTPKRSSTRTPCDNPRNPTR